MLPGEYPRVKKTSGHLRWRNNSQRVVDKALGPRTRICPV